MRVCILASENTATEIRNRPPAADTKINWEEDLPAFLAAEADAYIDLAFTASPERIQALQKLLPRPVFIHSVCYTTEQTDTSFIRINAWPGFLQRSITEIAIGKEMNPSRAATVLRALGWPYRIVPDLPGMIAARVVAMIINEAYLALEEQVSTREEIDTAMKLGTNYPFGPFEWAERIGVEAIRELLDIMSAEDVRYTPAPSLRKKQ